MDVPRSDGPEMTGQRFSPWRLLPLAAVAAGLAAFFVFDLDAYLSFETLSTYRDDLIAWRDHNYLAAAGLFVVLYALLVAFCVPVGVWLTIAAGFLFGVAAGMALTVSGATIGAVCIFLVARYALGDFLRAKTGRAVRRMEAGFRDSAFSYLMVLRLVPLFPFWLVNLVPAFLGVPLRTYALATVLGIVPGSFVYCGVGNGLGAVIDAGGTPDLGIIFKPAVLLPILGLVALSLLPIAYKRFRRDRT